MTEKKRFQYNVNKNTIEYEGKFVAYVMNVEGYCIANKMNILLQENEQLESNIDIRDKTIIELKEENKDLNDLLASKEDILLKRVIRIIDDKISEYKKYDGCDTEAYYIGTQLLKELRKEILKC